MKKIHALIRDDTGGIAPETAIIGLAAIGVFVLVIEGISAFVSPRAAVLFLVVLLIGPMLLQRLSELAEIGRGDYRPDPCLGDSRYVVAGFGVVLLLVNLVASLFTRDFHALDYTAPVLVIIIGAVLDGPVCQWRMRRSRHAIGQDSG